MTGKQQLYMFFILAQVFVYEPLLFSIMEASRKHEQLFFIAYTLLFLAGLLKLTIIFQEVIQNVSQDKN